ncbi:GIY-YIG nuclease family protein [Zavarzinella formosa]|uniref:GIY-YIG nuclease family protein n=1 Tax=Zavarzinella formosa TaxID=360055 RepID=UPI00030C1AB1|nr:GIY-YIG nuclease family protein [Zavarzinella formosa]
MSEKPAATTWVVYILRCRGGTLYTGITTDPARRLKQHNAGTAARYTRSHRPVKMVYQEDQPGRSEALKREAAIKRLTRAAKLKLIAG